MAVSESIKPIAGNVLLTQAESNRLRVELSGWKDVDSGIYKFAFKSGNSDLEIVETVSEENFDQPNADVSAVYIVQLDAESSGSQTIEVVAYDSSYNHNFRFIISGDGGCQAVRVNSEIELLTLFIQVFINTVD